MMLTQHLSPICIHGMNTQIQQTKKNVITRIPRNKECTVIYADNVLSCLVYVSKAASLSRNVESYLALHQGVGNTQGLVMPGSIVP